MTEATEVREVLDRFEAQNWNRHTAGAYDSVERLMEEVVEDGTFTPDVELSGELSLTARERVTGVRKQDFTGIFLTGLLLGAAMERDIPADTEAEARWRSNQYTLPE